MRKKNPRQRTAFLRGSVAKLRGSVAILRGSNLAFSHLAGKWLNAGFEPRKIAKDGRLHKFLPSPPRTTHLTK